MGDQDQWVQMENWLSCLYSFNQENKGIFSSDQA